LIFARANAAGAAEDADAYLQKAKTAFALGRHAEAAEAYEKAFEFKQDPAVLYNAAQAYRLAGNKEHALTLYENYLRVFGVKEKRAEVEAHIEALKKAIAHDKEVANSPPTGTEPVGGAPAGSVPAPASASPIRLDPPEAPAPPASAASPPVLVSQPSDAPAEKDRPVTKKPWFWAVVGGGIAAAVVVGFLVARGGSKDPVPSIGITGGD
jgi:tetratricopeptide (TPR) repeat protein